MGLATGVLFQRCALFPKMKDWQVVLIGIASSPMVAACVEYLLGLVFVGWSSLFFYAMPLLVAAVWLAYGRNYQLLSAFVAKVVNDVRKRMALRKTWIVIDFSVSLGILFVFALVYCSAISGIKSWIMKHLFLSALGLFMAGLIIGMSAQSLWCLLRIRKQRIRFCRNVLFVALLTIIGSMLFAGYCYNPAPMYESDLSHYEMNARYFLKDKNSWVIDNYTDERYGSSFRDDHGPLWITALAVPRIISNIVGVGDSYRVSRFNFFWIYLCFLGLLFLSAAHIANNGKAGIVSVLLFSLYLYEKSFILGGSRDGFRFIGLLLLFIYLGNMVLDVLENRKITGLFLSLSVFCVFSMNGHTGNGFIMLGMFLTMMFLLLYFKVDFKNVFFIGLTAFLGTVIGSLKTIFMFWETGKLWSGAITPFHDIPVIMEQSLTNYAMRFAWSRIWGSYTPSVLFMIGLGIIGLLLMLHIGWKRKRESVALLVWGSLMLGMLLPLSGCMDWIGYECSRWFFGQLRYRMYFLMVLSILGGWLLTTSWKKVQEKNVCAVLLMLVFACFISAEIKKYSIYNAEHFAWSRTVVAEYRTIANATYRSTDGNVFIDSRPVLYYIKRNPRLLSHMLAESLIQAKTWDEIEKAVCDLQVGAIVLPFNGKGGCDYTLLPFWDYIQEEFVCCASSDYGKYVIYYNPKFMK